MTTKLATLVVFGASVALGVGCASAPAGSEPVLDGPWRSVAGPEQFVEVGPYRIRTLTWSGADDCYWTFDYPRRDTTGLVYGVAAETWTLVPEDGGLLAGTRQGRGEASTRLFERWPYPLRTTDTCT